MQFNYPEGRKPSEPPAVEAGNVYSSKNTHKTKAWVVMRVCGSTAHLLGIDADGQVSTTQSYNVCTMERRSLIGHVDLSSLEFDIVPEEPNQ